MNTKDIGEQSEGMVMAALLRQGKVILKPWGDNRRYDLVIDMGNGVFWRVQCKTAKLDPTGQVLKFKPYTSKYSGELRDYVGDIEAFGVYSPELDRVYFVPIADTSRTACYLRLNKPASRSNHANVRYAADYEITSKPKLKTWDITVFNRVDKTGL